MPVNGNDKKIKINVTAVFTFDQVKKLKKVLNRNTKSIISIFAGRIADSGKDPETIIKNTIKLFYKKKNVQILWASCREIYNIFEAQSVGCDIITVPNNILNKLYLSKKFNIGLIYIFNSIFLILNFLEPYLVQ